MCLTMSNVLYYGCSILRVDLGSRVARFHKSFTEHDRRSPAKVLRGQTLNPKKLTNGRSQ